MAEQEPPAKKAPELCKGCINWENFSEKCWFFWHEKKECANHSDGFRSVKESFEISSMNYMPFLL